MTSGLASQSNHNPLSRVLQSLEPRHHYLPASSPQKRRRRSQNGVQGIRTQQEDLRTSLTCNGLAGWSVRKSEAVSRAAISTTRQPVYAWSCGLLSSVWVRQWPAVLDRRATWATLIPIVPHRASCCIYIYLDYRPPLSIRSPLCITYLLPKISKLK